MKDNAQHTQVKKKKRIVQQSNCDRFGSKLRFANWLHLLGRKRRNNTAGSDKETVKFEKKKSRGHSRQTQTHELEEESKETQSYMCKHCALLTTSPAHSFTQTRKYFILECPNRLAITL